MLESIVSYGLAVGAVYALIGITYNVMFSASRVFSFTAGMLGMLGGVLGAWFINKLGLPAIVGLVLARLTVSYDFLPLLFPLARVMRGPLIMVDAHDGQQNVMPHRRAFPGG